MNIETVAQNLKRTINGKEKALVEYTEMRDSLYTGLDAYKELYAGWVATVEMLKINIAELKRILQDVEQCIPKEPSNPYHNADSGLYGPEYQGQ